MRDSAIAELKSSDLFIEFESYCLQPSNYFAATIRKTVIASFEIAISSSSMHFIIACIVAAARKFAPMLACRLRQHWRGLGSSYRQRAMFIVKDLITH